MESLRLGFLTRLTTGKRLDASDLFSEQYIKESAIANNVPLKVICENQFALYATGLGRHVSILRFAKSPHSVRNSPVRPVGLYSKISKAVVSRLSELLSSSFKLSDTYSR